MVHRSSQSKLNVFGLDIWSKHHQNTLGASGRSLSVPGIPAKDCVFGLVDWKRSASQKRNTVAVGIKVAYHLQLAFQLTKWTEVAWCIALDVFLRSYAIWCGSRGWQLKIVFLILLFALVSRAQESLPYISDQALPKPIFTSIGKISLWHLMKAP